MLSSYIVSVIYYVFYQKNYTLKQQKFYLKNIFNIYQLFINYIRLKSLNKLRIYNINIELMNINDASEQVIHGF